jgi:hypothetical protein
MDVNKIDIQEGQRYKFESANKGEYTVLALGSDDVWYPSFMVCICFTVAVAGF